MKKTAYALSVLSSGALIVGAALAQDDGSGHLRIAAYNIQFLDSNNSEARLQAVREVIEAVDAHVFALQEIDDRAALEEVFDPGVWQLVIDDQSGERQDLAVAVREPLTVLGDLNADDEDFLFPNETDFFFPDRRDVLDVEVQVPGVDVPVHVLVVHLKARSGGRATTNPRRVGAAVRLLEVLEQDFDEIPFILLGDFNDNPDDQSLNILETGDPDAKIEIENTPGTFLVNLTEPLAALNQVTNSLFNMDFDQNGEIINIDVNSRNRNFDFSATDTHTGNILFDQILIPRSLLGHYIEGSATIFTGEENRGASDHLPVFADFRVQAMPGPVIDTVLIEALLPNPDGQDAGNETVTLRNFSETDVDLTNWFLRDRGNHTFDPSETIAAQASREFTIPVDQDGRSVMPLTNSGDEIELVNPDGAVVHRVKYTEVEALPGRVILTGPGS